MIRDVTTAAATPLACLAELNQFSVVGLCAAAPQYGRDARALRLDQCVGHVTGSDVTSRRRVYDRCACRGGRSYFGCRLVD